MLSNLIHFLNLFEYLNHSNKIRFNKKENNNQIIDSSRVGYDDLLGRITFINSIGSKLILINLKNHTKPSIEIDSSEFNLSFSELDSLIYIEDKVKKKLKIFYKKKPLTLQSNMSYNIIKQFINNRYLNLPKINETLQSDFVFLDLVKFFEKQYKKIIHNIMRYFISDIHGNLPALEKFVSKINEREDIIFMLGDLVNYGPWSNECIELLDTLSNVKYIMGNHEKYF